MAISGGSISGDSAQAPADELLAIYQGGDNFLARMKALEQGRNSYQQALAQLKIGNDILGAQAQAAAASETAARLQAAAQKALNDANAQAVAIVGAAQDKAQAILDSAHLEASNTVAQANSVKNDADSYAAKTKASADAALKDAEEQGKQARQLAAGHKAKSEAADAAKAAADAVRADAEAAKATYDQKVLQIKAVMSSAPAG